MAKLVRASLIDQIFDHIKDKIISGEWIANEKIPSESMLADTLGVSRMSLRMALQKANLLGLTETRVGDGTYVTDFSMRYYFESLYDLQLIPNNYMQINDFRTIMEIGSIRLALMRDDSDLDEEMALLEALYEEMEEHLTNNDYDAFYDADYRFHESICNMSLNPLIIMINDAMGAIMFDVSKANTEYSIERDQSFLNVMSFHKNLLEGLKQKDLDKCIEVEVSSFEVKRGQKL